MELTFEKAKQLREIKWEMRDVEKDFGGIKYLTTAICRTLEELVPSETDRKDFEISKFIEDYAEGEHFHKMVGMVYRYPTSKKVASVLQKILKKDKETNAKRYLKSTINLKLKELFGEEMFEVISDFTIEDEEREENKVLYYLALRFKETR